MKRFGAYLVLAIVLSVALSALSAFAQEEKTATKAPESQAAPSAVPQAAPAEPAASPAASPMPAMAPAEAVETGELSVYGEVRSVDAAANSITVQYYDYDTDEEKSAPIVFDSATKLENAANIGDIKQGDWADVTYLIKDGKNVAKSVIVEKEEMPTEAAAGAPAAAGLPEEEE